MTTGPGYLPEVLIGVGGVRVYGSSVVYVDGGQGMSSVTVDPGLAREAVINPLIAGGAKTFLFTEGTYSFSVKPFAGLTPSQLSSLNLLGLGDGRTVFTAAYAPAVGSASDPVNALLLFQGTTVAGVATTLAAGVPAIKGTRTITLTSGTGAVAGQVLRIGPTHNAPGNPTDQAGMSDGASVFLTELVEVESVAGAVITLTSILKQWHTPGASVTSATPVSDVLIRGISFDCAGGSIACGVSALMARRVKIEACWFRGFSRSAVDLEQGTRDVELLKLRGRGELNSLVLGDSAAAVVIEGATTDPQGLRFHTNGVASWYVSLLERCSDWQIRDSLLQHGNGGIRFWGGTDIQCGPGLKIRDMDPARIRTTDANYGPVAILGVGLEGGAGPLGIESFAFGIQFDDCELQNTFGIGDVNAWAWFLHDVRAVTVSGCGIWNQGPANGVVVNGVTFTPQGIRINDVQAIVESLHVSGCSNAIVTTGTPDVKWGHVKLSGQGADYVGATTPILFDHGGFSGMRFDSLQVEGFNTSSVFTYGANFTGNPDYSIRIGYFYRDGLIEGTELSVYQSTPAVSFGAVLEIDPTAAAGAKRLIASVGPSSHNAWVADPVGAGGYTFASPLPATLSTLSVVGAAGAGVILEANVLNGAVPNNAAAAGTKLGRILASKAAGTALARVGSVD